MSEPWQGLTLTRDLVERMVHDGIPHCRELGLRVMDVGEQAIVVKLPYQERLVGDPESGVLAGGAITTLIDTVCGMAVQAALRRLTAIATLDLRIDYLRPSAPGEDLIAVAECYRTTRHIAFVRSHAHNGDPERAVAHCVGTFMIGSSDKPVLPGMGPGRG